MVYKDNEKVKPFRIMLPKWVHIKNVWMQLKVCLFDELPEKYNKICQQ